MGANVVCAANIKMTTPALVTGSPIIAADEDRDDADLLRLLLRKAGLANPLQVFREGEQLVSSLGKLVQQSLKALRPLLCFLDVKMPAMSGLEVLHWIRAQPSLDRLPVVMLSSSEHPRDIQRAAQQGAQCYLTKYPQPALLKQVADDAERFAAGTPAEECFRLPENLLLVRCRRLRPSTAKSVNVAGPPVRAGAPSNQPRDVLAITRPSELRPR
jgi:CheY-like chemotaxis protein